ncbi:helix-turn-helix domain-containing protein [Bradyrhizobium genosp. A]|uniref:helix-turn-helix domain-containing protein n=1 Tax=Bradyrhizobium genosp. A TaxID=83626 RepID=UPI003CF4384C
MIEISASGSCRTVRRLDGKQSEYLVKFIDKNIRGDLSVARLSSELGISLSHFSRRFKETLGVSPHAFVANRRVLTAARLLTETEVSLEEIAEHVGFSSLGHFRSRFRQCLGCSPSEFRISIPNKATSSIFEKANQWRATLDLAINPPG